MIGASDSKPRRLLEFLWSMTGYAFSLQVPAASRYRTLAPDFASRVVEIIGGTKEEGVQFAAAVSDAVETIVAEARVSDAAVTFAFQTGSTGVDVTVRCAGHSSVVRHRLPAGQS